jgi:AcrR family transcriptional regulator
MSSLIDTKYVFVSISINMKSTRPYVMTARAEAMAQTRERILRASLALTDHLPLSTVSLADIAADADVSVQTVLRQFGSRDALIDAAIDLALVEIVEERHAPRDDLPRAMSVLLDHYESRGDSAILLLGQETIDPHAARITDKGRAMHRAWVEDVFTPQLGDTTGPSREELIDMLVIATDAYIWKILRRDRGLSRKVVERRMLRLVESVLAGWAS